MRDEEAIRQMLNRRRGARRALPEHTLSYDLVTREIRTLEWVLAIRAQPPGGRADA